MGRRAGRGRRRPVEAQSNAPPSVAELTRPFSSTKRSRRRHRHAIVGTERREPLLRPHTDRRWIATSIRNRT